MLKAIKTLRLLILLQLWSTKMAVQGHRTLIFQSASQSVKLERLPDSGILEVKLDRPETRNAIGKDMFRGLQQAFEAVTNERSANVLMICSSVPKVFCAGADLKDFASGSTVWLKTSLQMQFSLWVLDLGLVCNVIE